MIIYNPSQLDPKKINDLRVNRTGDLEECLETITERNENIVICGDRGIGKSFLIRLIELSLMNSFPNYLTIYLNMIGLFSNKEDETEFSAGRINDFPRLILLEMCRTIWVDKFKNNYSDLRNGLIEDSSIFQKPVSKKLKNIYNMLMTSQRGFNKKDVNGIGFSFSVKGEKKEESSYSWKENPMINFEFFEYIKEFKQDILSKIGIDKILVICDESNHLSISTQMELISRYGDLFSSHEIQMLFLSENPRKTENESFSKKNFDNIFHLRGFTRIDHLKELANKYIEEDCRISEEAFEILFELFKGNPRCTLNALYLSIKIMIKNNTKHIDAKMMSMCCFELLKKLNPEIKFS